jgi:transcription elongation factor SPT5
MSDSDNQASSNRKLKRTYASRFIEAAAEVSDEDVDPDEEEEDEDDDEVEIDAHKKLKIDNEVIVDNFSHAAFERDREEREVAIAAEKLEARFKLEGERMDAAEERGETYVEPISETQLMPSVKDPKIWLVKCDPGKEMLMVLQLMQKFSSFRRTTEKFHIYSAYCVPAAKGYIYVEADKKVHVEKAVESCPALKRYGVKLVPISEMKQSLYVRVDAPQIKLNQWVRIKGKGLPYGGDLALVVDLMDQNTFALIKMIPRIDYAELEEIYRRKDDDVDNDTRKKRPRSNKTIRPPQRMFDEEEISKFDDNLVVYDRKKEFYLFKNQRYSNGFLFKQVNVSRLEIDDVVATSDEIEKFRAGSKGKDDNLPDAFSNTSSSKVTTNLRQHDRVAVIKGDLQSFTGEVSFLVDNHVRINVDESLGSNQKIITVPAAYVRKIFDEGDHIKVLEGSHTNETGIVISINKTDG